MSTFIIFSLFFLSIIFHASPLPSSPTLLALNCTTTPHQTSFPNNSSIKPLLEHLTTEAQKTHFATLKTNHFTALMQCRLDLNQPNCSLCIKNAQNTILQLCPNSQFLTAWFDKCYLGYYPSYPPNNTHQEITLPKVSNHSCSSKSVPYNENSHFAPALEALLLTLRTKAASIETHHGFSHGELSYGKNGTRIYGVVECLGILSHQECGLCLGQAIERVEEQCGGRMGGVVVLEGHCLVWFESSKFFFDDVTTHGDGSMSSNIIVSNVDNGYTVKRILVLVWGIIGVAFVAIVGVCGCLLRRSIVNRVRVIIDSGVEGDKV